MTNQDKRKVPVWATFEEWLNVEEALRFTLQYFSEHDPDRFDRELRALHDFLHRIPYVYDYWFDGGEEWLPVQACWRY